MFDEKEEMSLEEELNQSNEQNKDEEVKINISSNKKHFNNRFKSLQIKYKKDPKKFIILASSIFVMLAMVIGSSYAYLTTTSKTNNSVTINAGTLALTFQNEANVINIENAVPMTDKEGLAQEQEYSFDIRNTGSIPAQYTITLNNTCSVEGNIDVCIPDQYIKVGIKIVAGKYKVIQVKNNRFVIDANTMPKNTSKAYNLLL